MADGPDQLAQDAGEQSHPQAQAEDAPSSQTAPAAPNEKPPAAENGAARPSPDDIDFLIDQAEAALASATDPASELPPGVGSFKLEDFVGSPASTDEATLELIRDVQLDLKIELGRTHMHLEDVLRLKKGAVVALDKLAGDPVDVYVNGRLIARGEILVLNDNFCVRVAELVVGEAVA